MQRNSKITFVLIALNVLVYIFSQWPGVIERYALYAPSVLAGEWWLLLTSTVLHSGIVHIASNMICLYYIGPLIEHLYGKWQLLLIYTVSALSGGALVTLVDTLTGAPNLTVGASGAIFGLYGAYFAIGLTYRGTMNIRETLLNLALMLLPGFLSSNISLMGHIGGIIGGLITGVILSDISKRRYTRSQRLG